MPAVVGGQWETEGLGTGEGAWTLGMEVRGERGPVSATRTGGQPLFSWTPAACGFPTEDHPLASQQKPLLLCAVLPEAERALRVCRSAVRLSQAICTQPGLTPDGGAHAVLFRGQRPPCAWPGAPGWSVASSCCSVPSPLEQLRFHHPQREGRIRPPPPRRCGENHR